QGIVHEHDRQAAHRGRHEAPGARLHVLLNRRPGCARHIRDRERWILTAESDAMHAILMRRVDALQGCTEGSPEELEPVRIVTAIEAYEAKRWPEGKEPGGKC